MKRKIYSGLFALLLLLQGGVSVASNGLTLGVFPRFNQGELITMFTPLADHLSRELGQTVRLHVSKDFDSFWWELESGRFDIVHFNQYHYVKAHKLFGYEVILRNEEGGSDTLTGELRVRRSSPITRVEQLRGKQILFGGGPSAMMSYIVPRQLLQQRGLSPDDYQAQFARNPPNALLGLQTEVIDAAAVGSSCVSMEVVERQVGRGDTRLLAASQPLAQLPWAVHRRVDPLLRDEIRSAMLRLNNDAKGKRLLRQMGLTGLVPTEDRDYDEHRQIIRDVLGEHY